MRHYCQYEIAPYLATWIGLVRAPKLYLRYATRISRDDPVPKLLAWSRELPDLELSLLRSVCINRWVDIRGETHYYCYEMSYHHIYDVNHNQVSCLTFLLPNSNPGFGDNPLRRS